MENTTYIKDNYKQSTIVRLQEVFKYVDHQDINKDIDLTDALTFLKDQGLETQRALIEVLQAIKENK
jgi:hypothetical protein